MRTGYVGLRLMAFILLMISMGMFVGCRKGGGDVVAPMDPQVSRSDRSKDRVAENRKGESEKPQKVTWDQPAAKNGASVVIRLTPTPGRVRVYDGSFSRKQAGKNSYTETAAFYLTFYNVDRTSSGFNRTSIRRSFLDRKKLEILENGKKIDRILQNSDKILNLGPNSDMVAGNRCYAFDAQNRVAYRSESLLLLKTGERKRGIIITDDENYIELESASRREQIPRASIAVIQRVSTPHLLRYDTPHFFFPIFSKRAVSPGDSWRFRVPVIIPLEQGSQRSVLPTQFEVILVGRLREVTGSGSEQVAVVDYKFSGLFDTALDKFKTRYGRGFLARNRVYHQVDGSGTVRVHVARGLILNKQEDVKITLFASTVVPQKDNQPPKKNDSQLMITSKFQMKWVPPGTRLRTGAVVPKE